SGPPPSRREHSSRTEAPCNTGGRIVQEGLLLIRKHRPLRPGYWNPESSWGERNRERHLKETIRHMNLSNLVEKERGPRECVLERPLLDEPESSDCPDRDR